MSENNLPLSILLVGGYPMDVFDNAGGTLAYHAATGGHDARGAIARHQAD